MSRFWCKSQSWYIMSMCMCCIHLSLNPLVKPFVRRIPQRINERPSQLRKHLFCACTGKHEFWDWGHKQDLNLETGNYLSNEWQTAVHMFVVCPLRRLVCWCVSCASFFFARLSAVCLSVCLCVFCLSWLGRFRTVVCLIVICFPFRVCFWIGLRSVYHCCLLYISFFIFLAGDFDMQHASIVERSFRSVL